MHRPPLFSQKAVVTGASSGLGRAVAIALASAGADVVVNYASAPLGAEAVVTEARRLGVRSFAHKANVANEREVADMFEGVRRELGTLDILVANAGIQADATIDSMTLEQWNSVLAINLTGQFLCAREAVREFRRQGVVADVSCAAGKIICMSSVHQEIPWAGHLNYATSKGGVAMFMHSLTQEVAAERIRVNAIAPGAIRTPINRTVWDNEQTLPQLLTLIPYGRLGEPEDVARAAVWLASDDADYVVGTTLFVDGGMSLDPCFVGNG